MIKLNVASSVFITGALAGCPTLVDAWQAKVRAGRHPEQTAGLLGSVRAHARDDEGVWFGGADPRQEGTVEGD